MKLVKQSYEILTQEIPVRKLDDYSGEHFREQYINNMYKHIERCGRTCYKSERLITPDSAKRFVEGLIKTKHYSVLEHAIIYLKISDKLDGFISLSPGCTFNYKDNEYSKWKRIGWNDSEGNERFTDYITTNYRVLIENGWEDDLQYLCEPGEYHELRHTVLLHGCIHTYKDLTRHRKASFSIESTRYCNYSKTDKFGEMKFVYLPWLTIESQDKALSQLNSNLVNFISKYIERLFGNNILYFTNAEAYISQCAIDECTYTEMVRNGFDDSDISWQPQQAAEVLPQCTAADIVMTAYASDWKFIFDLRSDTAATGKPHPLVEELMTPLRDEFKENNWI